MKLNTLKYFFVDAFKSLKRNKTLSIAAMITVLITFFIFGTFILIGLNFNKAIDDVASKLEIKVYLDNDIKLIDQREIELKLNELDGVKEVIYESKEEAFINLKDMLKDNQGLLEGYDLEDNPLPSSFIVKLLSSFASNIILLDFPICVVSSFILTMLLFLLFIIVIALPCN